MRLANTHDLGYIQMDTKHVTPELGGLATTCYEYAAIDIFSRYKLAILLPDITDECAGLALDNAVRNTKFTIISFTKTLPPIQKFILKYNTWRPHQALNYQTPAKFVKLYQESVTKVVLP